MSNRGFEVKLQRLANESQRTQIPYQPPMIEFARNPSDFYLWWRMLYYVYHLPDPGDFPKVTPFDLNTYGILRRYVTTCESLARSGFLNTGRNYILGTSNGQLAEDSLLEGPDEDFTRSAAVLFRQLYEPHEAASFNRARNLLSEHVSQHGARSDTEELVDILRQWRLAHTDLLKAPLPLIADNAAMAYRSGGPRLPVDLGDLPSPPELFRLFAYGDLIHWGERRDELAAYKQNAGLDLVLQVNFLESLLPLSHFYLGFGVLVKSAIALG